MDTSQPNDPPADRSRPTAVGTLSYQSSRPVQNKHLVDEDELETRLTVMIGFLALPSLGGVIAFMVMLESTRGFTLNLWGFATAMLLLGPALAVMLSLLTYLDVARVRFWPIIVGVAAVISLLYASVAIALGLLYIWFFDGLIAKVAVLFPLLYCLLWFWHGVRVLVSVGRYTAQTAARRSR